MPIRMKRTTQTLAFAVTLIAINNMAGAQQAASAPKQTPPAQPAIEEWGDDFDGDQLDDKKWEPYTFEGGGGAKIEVKDKQLKMRGAGGARTGVRSRQTFSAERAWRASLSARVRNSCGAVRRQPYQPR